MGNNLGSVVDRRYTIVMKVSGETLKFRAPVHAAEILKVHPGHVLLEAEEVKKFGTRTKPLGFDELLEAKKLYFLVELPKTMEENRPLMKRSTAEKKLEKLMVARKSASVSPLPSPQGGACGGRRVTVRLSKEEYRKVMRDSKDGAEAAMKIMQIYGAAASLNNGDHKDQNCGGVKISDQDAADQPTRMRERRVRFLDATQG